MSEVLKGSWRSALGYAYLSSEDMSGNQERVLTIKSVTREMAYDKKAKTEKPLVTIAFEETERLLGLNATNARAISEIADSHMVEKWVGHKVTIYRINESFFGRTGALRVKAPPVEPEQVSEAS